jgi:EAL domain-containing protein (putative c-di-GMP-specific phosphodiesterase class I)
MLAAADEALYEAKYKGRNRTVVSSDAIRERVKKRREIVSDLLVAIEKREFEAFFQLQVDARTHEIIGMEALARWPKSSGKILGPGEFMPAAAENDLIRLIDAIIFDKCAVFLRKAQSLGLEIPALSINLSEDHLKDDGLLDRLLELRKASDTKIAVELLETTALDDPSEHLSWTIDKIRDLGFGIEIDDFGTGKTSIMSLTTLRPSRLKIARELIIPIEEQENRKVLSCVLEIAKTLEINTLAEGIETEDQRQILLDLGCYAHQGFLYAHPQCSETILETLMERSDAKQVG